MAANADDLAAVRREARRFLSEQVVNGRLEALLDTPGGFDLELWRRAAEQGWLVVGLSETHGGAGLGWPAVAALAEEMGRSLAALPVIPGTLAAALVAQIPQTDPGGRWADGLREGGSLACLALPGLHVGSIFGTGNVRSTEGRLRGQVGTVAFGAVADIALVAASSEAHGDGLWLVPLEAAEVTRHVLTTLDDARALATLRFEGAPAIRVGGADILAQIVERAVTLAAFEQIGGAQASLMLAIEHALQREAFGQPIARFQAIKHKLVEVYAAIEIARGCALTALELVAEEAADLERHEAVAAARIAASQAYEQSARECINVFGALGLTREAAPHRHYRRARSLALEIGSVSLWRESLVQHFLTRVVLGPGG